MTYRTIITLCSTTTAHKVSVSYASDLGEYRCRITLSGKVCPDADYFTDDRAEAVQNAKTMLRHAELHTKL